MAESRLFMKALTSAALFFIGAFYHHGTAVAAMPVFTEVGAASGVLFQSADNPMSAGIAWIDYDNDGNQDLFVPSASGPNRLYHNEGNGQFLELGAQLNVQRATEPSLGVAIGDYDGDGNDDIFIANGDIKNNTGISNTLLRNKGDSDNDGDHDGFEDVTASALIANELKVSLAGAFGDVDGDLDLDLYVSHWDGVSQPGGVCAGNDLYLNNGNGTFTRAPPSVGVDDVGCSFVSTMTDFDGDTDLDLFVVNDNLDWFAGNPALDNDMLRNDGIDSNGLPVFTSVGDEVGLGEGLTGMGLAIGDFDNDGDFDYYRTEVWGGYVLSINDGTGKFVGTGGLEIGPGVGIGWGTAFFDANNDGFVDLYRANSGSGFGGDGQENWFYLNNRGVLFSEMAASVGLSSVNAGLGLAFADYDNDGDVDVVVHGQYGDVNLFRNDTSTPDGWLSVRLEGRLPNHRGIGAKLRVTTSNGSETRQQMREIHAGSSHGSTHAAPVQFGLGDHSVIESLTVQWPGGCVQNVDVQAINAAQTVSQAQCIKGTVRNANGNPVAGAVLLIADNFGFSTTVTTDVHGRYSQQVPNGWYVVTTDVSSPYTLAPVDGNILANVSGEDVTKDFIATPVPNTVSGTVRDNVGNPVSGAVLFIADNFGFSTTVTTDANGQYSQQVPGNGWYVVTTDVSSPYTLTPVDGNILVNVSGEDVIKDFIATPVPHTISGTVRDNAGNPVSGAVLFIADNFGFSTTVTTGANGQYSQQVPGNGWYVVMADASSPYALTPVNGNILVNVSGENVTKNFIATPL